MHHPLLACSAYTGGTLGTVTTFLEETAAYTAAEARALRDAADIPNVNGIRIVHGQWGYADQLMGLIPTDPDGDTPPGWKAKSSRRGNTTYVPVKGVAGQAATAWLAAHKLPRDPRLTLVRAGLPQNGLRPTGKGDGSVYHTRPLLLVHDGQIYALYEGAPDGQVGAQWRRIPLSEFFVAYEAHHAAKTETPAGV